MAKKWYVIQTYSGFENKVKSALQDRIKQFQMEDRFGEVLIPTAEAIDAYLVEQKLTPATLIGHSLGGTTTLYLAEKHGAHLKKALMVDALPFFGGMQDPKATADSVRPMAQRIIDGTAASNAQATKAMLAPQMRAMSKDESTRDMIVEWGVASDRMVVAHAMYDDLTLDLRDEAGFEAFLYEYGSRGPNEWDIYSEVWETKPALALALIDSMRATGPEADPKARFTVVVADREAAMAEALAAEVAVKPGARVRRVGFGA